MRRGSGSNVAGKRVVEHCGNKSSCRSGCWITVVCSCVSSNVTRCEAISLHWKICGGAADVIGRFCWALTSLSRLWKELGGNCMYPPTAQRQVCLLYATSCHPPHTSPRIHQLGSRGIPSPGFILFAILYVGHGPVDKVTLFMTVFVFF